MAGLERALPLLLLALVAGGCGDAGPAAPAAPTAGGWERLPQPPIGPREPGVALSLGGEALFLGGSDGDPCPPSAGCVAPTAPPLREGAAFDPASGSWTRLADAPVGFSFAYAATLGRDAYLLVPGEPGRPQAPAAFLRYERAADRWTRLELPPDAGRRWLVATDEEVIAYASEAGPLADLAFDPARGAWRELPGDPLTAASGRTMAWSGEELVLFASPVVTGAQPPLLTAAALDPATGAWRRLPDSGMVGNGGVWFAHDGRLILPVAGGADGGETDNWGREYPYGGVLDVAAGRWQGLPEGGPEDEYDFIGGVVAGDRAQLHGPGWVLDAVTEEWSSVPRLDADASGVMRGMGAAAGRALVVFGGVRWSGAHGELLDEAWSWRVP